MAVEDQAQILRGYANALVAQAETGKLPIGAQFNGDATIRVGITAGIVAQDEQHLPQPLPVAPDPD